MIELRLNGDQFMLTLWIDSDRLNAIDRNRFVVDPIDLLLTEQLQGFCDPNRLVGVIRPVCVAELGDDIGVIGNGQKRLYLLLIPRRPIPTTCSRQGANWKAPL